MDVPQPPKGISNDADNGFTGTAATQPKPAGQTAGAQQPAAATAAQPKKKPAYDGPGLQRPAKSGFMQQLTGVVGQGKNLMRSDIDGRMGAWHDATQHPERASEFLKAYRARQYAGGIEDLEGIGNRAGQLDSVAKYGTTAYFDPIAPPAEYPVSDDPDVANGQISQAAYTNTFDYDHAADQRFDKDREREFVHGREAGNAMNGVGAEKPRVKTVEAMPSPYEFLNGEIEDVDVTEDVAPYYDYKGVKSAPGLMGRAKKAAFKESATLLDGYLDNLQDRGFITKDQKEFLRSDFKEAVPQHEVDTKRKKDTPRSAINAYKKKQTAIDKDVETDQKKAYLRRLFRDYSNGISANDIGADKVRSKTYVYHPYDEDYEPIPYWSDETEWGPELLKRVAQNTANRMTGKETDGVIYGHNEVKRPPAQTIDGFVNGPQDD